MLRTLNPRRIAAILAIASMVLVIINIGIGLQLQSQRGELAQHQEYLAQTQQLARINQVLVNSLAEIGQRDHDEKVLTLLANNGVTIRPIEPPKAAEPAKAGPSKGEAGTTP